jgi:exopolysaccharide biosynthesis protein
MAGRNDRAPYGRGRMEHGRAPGRGRRRFRWNFVNVGIIAVVILTGLIVGAVLLTRQGGEGEGEPTPGTTGGGAVQPSTAPSDNPETVGPSASVTPDTAETTEPVSDETAPADPTASPDESGGGTASEYFTSGDVQVDDTTYRSADLYVKVTNVNEGGVNYYVADCRMKDGNRLFTALAGDKYALHKGEKTSAMARRKGAVVAINGDYYGYRTEGIVLRNGTLYRKTPYYDVAAIYGDGTMKTFAKGDADADELIQDGVVQAFGFGPMLLDADGRAFPEAEMKKRKPQVNPLNPRAGIGYIEPNHFVLVVVDGRGAGGSKGMTQTQFSKLFESLGCKSAYNFDGGGTATMVFMGRVLNHPCDEGGERSVSDIVYFGESETDQANIARMNGQ